MNQRIIEIFRLFQGEFSFINLCKNEQLDMLKQLLNIEDFLIKIKLQNLLANDDPVLYDNLERYYEMAMRIDPTDTFIIYRKTEYKSIKNFKIFDSSTSIDTIRILM